MPHAAPQKLLASSGCVMLRMMMARVPLRAAAAEGWLRSSGRAPCCRAVRAGGKVGYSARNRVGRMSPARGKGCTQAGQEPHARALE